MDGGRTAGQSEKERFLLEIEVTSMLVLCDQIEVKVIEQCLKTTVLDRFVRYVIKKT